MKCPICGFDNPKHLLTCVFCEKPLNYGNSKSGGGSFFKVLKDNIWLIITLVIIIPNIIPQSVVNKLENMIRPFSKQYIVPNIELFRFIVVAMAMSYLISHAAIGLQELFWKYDSMSVNKIWWRGELSPRQKDNRRKATRFLGFLFALSAPWLCADIMKVTPAILGLIVGGLFYSYFQWCYVSFSEQPKEDTHGVPSLRMALASIFIVVISPIAALFLLVYSALSQHLQMKLQALYVITIVFLLIISVSFKLLLRQK